MEVGIVVFIFASDCGIEVAAPINCTVVSWRLVPSNIEWILVLLVIVDVVSCDSSL